jgi:hypothetical protein
MIPNFGKYCPQLTEKDKGKMKIIKNIAMLLTRCTFITTIVVASIDASKENPFGHRNSQ